MIFAAGALARPSAGRVRGAGGASGGRRRHALMPPGRSCQAKSAGATPPAVAIISTNALATFASRAGRTASRWVGHGHGRTEGRSHRAAVQLFVLLVSEPILAE